jgi:hypothetical protein
MSSDDDQMVASYLDKLRTAAIALPPDRASELIEEITNHIAEARAACPVPPVLLGIIAAQDRRGQSGRGVRARPSQVPASTWMTATSRVTAIPTAA